jgi:F-type H+-transporting ATPase subunit b
MISLAFAENSIQLVPDGTLFFHIAIILIMVFVLNATLFKPINKILEERERRTRGRSGEAYDIMRRVEEKISHYEKTMREARSDGYRLMEQERAAAMAERQATLNAVREEMSNLLAEQKEAINAQSQEVRTALSAEARRLAGEISEQLLQRPISDAVLRNVGTNA